MDGFDVFIEKNGFIQDPEDNLRWVAEGAYKWEYILYYEGYAYVLYAKYKKFEVPLTHFHCPKKLQIFYDILNTELDT